MKVFPRHLAAHSLALLPPPAWRLMQTLISAGITGSAKALRSKPPPWMLSDKSEIASDIHGRARLRRHQLAQSDKRGIAWRF